jgi:multidrug transporter EmrE-like cation transporter
MIWIGYLLLTVITSIASFKNWGMGPLLLFAFMINILWAYLSQTTLDKKILLNYSLYWNVGFVIIFSVVPVLLGVQPDLKFWIGLGLILAGIGIIGY